MMQGDAYMKQIQIQKDELYKIKKQVSDQRREYNKLLASDARADHLTDTLIKIAKEMNLQHPMYFGEPTSLSDDKEALIVLSDWHYGLVTDNIWNTYSVDICKQRIHALVNKIKTHLTTHKVGRIHVMLLGDMAHGSIHTSCRVSSEEDTCDQIMNVSELLANAINEISNADSVFEVNVYSTYGNHLRTIQNKKDSIHSDNMEKLIPWWLRQRLQNNPKVNVIDSEFKEFIKINILGYNICGVHGDLDKIKNLGVTVNTLFSKLYGETIDYTVSGDKHHLEEFESFDIESILVRSLCGSDGYANDHRLYSNAGQTMMIFTPEDGRECTYNIKLN